MPLTIKITQVLGGQMPTVTTFTKNQPPTAINMAGSRTQPRIFFELHATAPTGKTLVGVNYMVHTTDLWLGNPDKFVKADFQYANVKHLKNLLVWPSRADMVTGNIIPGELVLDLPSDRAIRLTAKALGNIEPIVVTAVYFAFQLP